MVDDPATVRYKFVDFSGRFTAATGRRSVNGEWLKSQLRIQRFKMQLCHRRWAKTTIWSALYSPACKRIVSMSMISRTFIHCASNIACIHKFATGPTNIFIEIASFRRRPPSKQNSSWIRTECSVWSSCNRATAAPTIATRTKPDSSSNYWRLWSATLIRSVSRTE